MEQTTARQHELARIARDLHDELGASLAQIAMRGNRAQKLWEGDAAQQARLAEIYDRARESTRRLDEIVWAVNPARDTLEHLVSYLCKFSKEYLTLAEVRFRVYVPDELPLVPLDSGVRHNVFLSAREAIHNAVRHGRPDTVTLRVAVETDCFAVVSEDDGRGFEAATLLAAGRDSDVNLPGANGVQCVERLAPVLPKTYFIMLTVFDDTEVVFQSLSAGAIGCLTKPVTSERLLEAIRDVCEGGAPMTSSIAQRIVQAFRKPAADSRVTVAESLAPREQEVLKLLSKKKLADQLAISFPTVHTLTARIYTKLHVHSRSQAVAKYLGEHG